MAWAVVGGLLSAAKRGATRALPHTQQAAQHPVVVHVQERASGNASASAPEASGGFSLEDVVALEGPQQSANANVATHITKDMEDGLYLPYCQDKSFAKFPAAIGISLRECDHICCRCLASVPPEVASWLAELRPS